MCCQAIKDVHVVIPKLSVFVILETIYFEDTGSPKNQALPYITIYYLVPLKVCILYLCENVIGTNF